MSGEYRPPKIPLPALAGGALALGGYALYTLYRKKGATGGEGGTSNKAPVNWDDLADKVKAGKKD